MNYDSTHVSDENLFSIILCQTIEFNLHTYDIRQQFCRSIFSCLSSLEKKIL